MSHVFKDKAEIYEKSTCLRQNTNRLRPYARPLNRYKTMPQAFGGYHLLLVTTCNQTNFTIAVPLRDRTAQMVAEALIYRVIYLFGLLRQIIWDGAMEFSSAVIQDILCMLNCRLKVISPYNHGSSKCRRQIQTISEIIMKHLWDK